MNAICDFCNNTSTHREVGYYGEGFNGCLIHNLEWLLADADFVPHVDKHKNSWMINRQMGAILLYTSQKTAIKPH